MGDLRSELNRIYSSRGELTPQAVVDEAREESSPLHHRFEWNDSVAGEKYRIIQAQQIIRSVRIDFTSASGEKNSLREFHAARESGVPERQGYLPVGEIVQDDLAFKILLRDLERDIAELKRKYGHLQEFAEIIRLRLAA